MNPKILGIDIAKSVFHIHAVDGRGKELFHKKVYRSDLLRVVANIPACRVVLEACGSSNYWAREFEKHGHQVDLIAPQYVKPFVQRNKNDWKDAEAICVASQQPHMRYVPKKSSEQQDIQNLHRVRERLVRSRTALVNELRGFLNECGIVIPRGRRVFAAKFIELVSQHEHSLNALTTETLYELWSEYINLDERIKSYEQKLQAIAKSSALCTRLQTIPGIGFLTATALYAAIGNAQVFKNGRELAAWLGITPREYSTGGKQRLLGISKRGDCYLRKLLIHGARVTLRYAGRKTDPLSRWATDLKQRKGTNRASVALANKNARIAWALITKNKEFQLAA